MQKVVYLYISIHSTARVETNLSTFLGVISKFQSTPPRGWRRHACQFIRFLCRFQSTPPRGWRLKRGAKSGLPLYFNPLHREGGDVSPAYLLSLVNVFQSTPPRGWRQAISVIYICACAISIHSTARVETGRYAFGSADR